MQKKSATLTDIANHLDIDVSTVSKALKDHPKISEKTKVKVREAARQLNYHPNHIATALVKGRSNLTGVMVPFTDENFFAAAIRGIDDVLKNEGYRIIIFQSYDNPSVEINNIETMLQTKVDGIIASHAMKTENFEHFQSVLDQHIPLVLFDRFNDKIDSDVIAIDDFKGAYKAVSHLIDQGCRKIAHISGTQTVHIYNERIRGYKRALQEHDLPYDPEYILESDMSLEGGRKKTSALLAREILPDAIFCSNDYTALGAIQVLKEEGIKIPEQVAIVGFSNEDFTTFVTPTITTVDQHSRQMGRIAAQHFLNQISNRQETILPQKTILAPELIIRESSLKKR
ncbi:MAG: LacI family DNA-binding transcriptional regulator [Balneolaceae bacterium]|nr:LacI family DNA-binding transcriptional regulator [Balneolaceae bacterium]